MQTQYFEYTRTEILPLLPEHVSSVLEIGCGTGNTLSWLKTFRNCSWVGGVELNADAAEQAKKKLDAVFQENIENVRLPLQHQSLDLILCLDVLEHLVDPWSVVSNLTNLLKVGGSIVVSIPNIRHRSVVFPLLFKGRWKYVEAGMLDRSHLRFFTRESAISLVQSEQIMVDMVLATGLGKSRKSKIVNDLLPGGIRALFEKQYLIRGKRVR